MCKICQENPVIIVQGDRKLCKGCFIKYFEKKVFKTIRQYKLIDKKDVVAVGVSGGKDSITMLNILNKIMSPRKGKFFALLIDEGIENYRDITKESAVKFCKDQGITLKIVSTKRNLARH